MTTSSTPPREQYATNGVTTAFTIHFSFFDDTDVNAVFVDSGGSSTTLAINTDFTVTGGDGSGGTLTTTGSLSPLSNGGTLTIYREIPFTQESDYVEDDPLPADQLESDFDRAVMRDQQLQDAADRALAFPVTVDPNVSGELPTPVANEFLRFSSDGLSITSSPISALGAVGQATETVAGIGEVATDAEMTTGTDDTVFGTAKKIATYVASRFTAFLAATNSFTGLNTFQNTKSTVQTLTDAATIAWDVSAGNTAKVTLTASGHAFGAPTNVQTGGFYFLAVIQDGTGSRTATWNAVFKFGTPGTPTLTTTASKIDYFTFYSPDGTNLHCVGKTQGF